MRRRPQWTTRSLAGLAAVSVSGRSLIVAAITRVYAVRLAAKILGRVEELLWELADQLEPENGMLWKDLIAACIRHVTFASLQRGDYPARDDMT